MLKLYPFIAFSIAICYGNLGAKHLGSKTSKVYQLISIKILERKQTAQYSPALDVLFDFPLFFFVEASTWLIMGCGSMPPLSKWHSYASKFFV